MGVFSMATNTAPADPLTTMQVNAAPTAPLSPTQSVAPAPASTPVTVPGQTQSPEPVVDRGDPDLPHETQEQATGVGTEGETVVWEARYAMKNFLGRLILLGALTLAWAAWGVYTWGYGHVDMQVPPILAGIVLGIAWLVVGRQIVYARFGHYYRLTNRRVFVSTGFFDRRRDQMELLRVQDVYTRQSLVQRWLGIGTVVVVSSEPHLPLIYLAGVADPKYVMDLVWHHARAERDRRSVKVDRI